MPEDNNYTDNLTITFNTTVFDNENLTNVSLYLNLNGTWHLNETNSSGINNTDYVFIKDMSSQGIFYWKIKACDNDDNCIFSSSRTFTIDTAYPQVSLMGIIQILKDYIIREIPFFSRHSDFINFVDVS